MVVPEAVVESLPSLAPIRTSTIHEKRAEAKPELRISDKDCVTPRSEESEIQPSLVCPPAPRKPRPAKRKMVPLSRGFYTVPRDLTSVFLALPAAPEKRIRVL